MSHYDASHYVVVLLYYRLIAFNMRYWDIYIYYHGFAYPYSNRCSGISPHKVLLI
jgi:hypothetical protein